eukprot:347712-Chlamydomonas_euryale.AAC.1
MRVWESQCSTKRQRDTAPRLPEGYPAARRCRSERGPRATPGRPADASATRGLPRPHSASGG